MTANTLSALGIIAFVSVLLGFFSEHLRHMRARRDICKAQGHDWQPPSGADHPDTLLCCRRCYKEVR